MARRGRKRKRRGRKRKNGHRWANGNVKQPSAAERRKIAQELADLEKAVVLAQPHRRGDLSQHRESPLGRLAARWKLRTEIIDAGFQYGRKVRLWQVMNGVPIEIHAPSQGNQGGWTPAPRAAGMSRSSGSTRR